MGDPVEVELKLEFMAGDAVALRSAGELGAADDAAERHLVATYFDTPAADLARAGFSLRIRRDGRQHIQTLKAGGKAAGLFVRPEWDLPVRGWTLVLDDPRSPFTDMLDPAWIERIGPAFRTDVHRHRRRINFGDARIECAIDTGRVDSGAHKVVVAELELELLDGDAAALFALARALDRHAPLRLGVLSKAERGYRLLDLAASGGDAVRGEPIRLGPEANARTAFAAVITTCIRHYRLNEALILAADGDEPIHQARVALRRLRSAFTLFKPLFGDDPDATRLRGELRCLAGELGKVRDIDVLIPRVDRPAQALLGAERARRFTGLRDALDLSRARALPLDLVEWMALGRWRDAADLQTVQQLPARDFAKIVLAKRYRSVRRRGRDLAKLDNEHRHRVRIEAKKLRYAADFFASCFGEDEAATKRHATFVKALARLQDKLGDLNDVAMGAELLASLGITATLTPDGAPRDKVLRKAAKAFDRLIDTRRFWKD
ncbi:inorganic triphosphatase YgiF [Sphingomonas zeicaulis]|uniref:CYTH and CHAD domain-containing protein n=1 Tax=Sphingomonas zeicaulis TaxID=1632740 RepID=UPI003D224CF7